MNSKVFLLVLITGSCLGRELASQKHEKVSSYDSDLVSQKHGKVSSYDDDDKTHFPLSVEKSNTIHEPFGNTTAQGTALVRHKRGWISVLFVGVSILVKTTALGLTIASAVTDGCSYYPSICKNRDAIEVIDKDLKRMSQIYEKEYRQSKKRFYELKTASTNNGYINYYIDQTMQAVESIGEIEENVTLYLQLSLPKLSGMAASSANITYEKYLTQVVGALEHRLSDLKDMLNHKKKLALIGIVVQFAIEATINKFVKAIKTAYTQVTATKLPEDILNSAAESLWERMENSRSQSPTSTRFKIVERFKYSRFVLTGKQLFKNGWKSIKNFGKTIKSLHTKRGWKALGGRIKTKLQPIITKFQNAKKFFTPSQHKQFVKNFKLGWSQKLMMGLGVIGDAVSIAVQVHQWNKVAKQMENARINYEKYQSKLKRELDLIQKENLKMDGIWLNVVEVFKNLSLTFKELVVNATQYKDFSGVLGFSKLPVDTSGPLFTINFNHITRETVLPQQESVKQFLETVNYNITEIRDEMIARQFLYTNALEMSQNEETLADIHDDIKRMFRFNPSETMKNFGKNLSLFDTVCTISVLRSDLDEYDYFPVDGFRPRCEVNATTFELWKQNAFTKRKSRLMRDVIIRTLAKSKKESLSQLLDAVHNAYSGVGDEQIKSYGRTIRENDVICAVASIYTNKAFYDFIQLGDLRPDCSAVSPTQFKKILEEAEKRRSLVDAVTGVLSTCRNYKVCPCLLDVANKNQVKEGDVIYALKQIEPAWKQSTDAAYCGTAGCSCNHI